MFKKIIENYINNMTINDIIMFSHKENIYLNDSEYLKIYEFIKHNWDSIINNDNLVNDFLIKNFDNEKKDIIYELYLKYQKKYSSYL